MYSYGNRERNLFVSINNCNDYRKPILLATFLPTSLFPLIHLEFMFLWRKNLEGLCFVFYPDFTDTTRIGATQWAVVEIARDLCTVLEKWWKSKKKKTTGINWLLCLILALKNIIYMRTFGNWFKIHFIVAPKLFS